MGKCKFRWCKNSEIKDKNKNNVVIFYKKSKFKHWKILIWLKETVNIKEKNVVIILVKIKYQILEKCKFRWCKNRKIKDKSKNNVVIFCKKNKFKFR